MSCVSDDNISQDAEAYVDSIMSSQRITRVDTPQHSGRKRHLSVPFASDSTVKKARNDNDNSRRVMVTAKRSLYPSIPTPAPRNIGVTRADVHHDSDIGV